MGQTDRFIAICALAAGMGLASAKPGLKPPAKSGPKSAQPKSLVVKANNAFAIDLYRQLAAENKGGNLFFSPFSVSVALAMTAEGAQGETAGQMGSVLRYPRKIRNPGGAQAERPWDMERIHLGMAALRAGLEAQADSARTRMAEAEASRLRAQIDSLRASRPGLGAPYDPATPVKQRERYFDGIRRERMLVARLNEELGKISPFELGNANSIWAERLYPFRQEYFRVIGRYYGTDGAFPADFKYHPDAERVRINAWVSERTRNRIPDLIPPGGITPDTRMALVNAIYFKGDWAMPFPARNTRSQAFTLANALQTILPIMHVPSLDSARYAAFNADGSLFKTPWQAGCGDPDAAGYPDSSGFAMVELPYKGGALSMVVIAPNRPAGLESLERLLDAGKLAGWIDRMQRRAVDAYLPRFSARFRCTLGDMNGGGALRKLGMNRAFTDPRRADGAQFERMSQAEDPGNKLYISLVLHNAFVEVNEKGTEAAAATVVLMAVPASSRRDCGFKPVFRADRPFLYLIRDRATGAILFMGRMADPR